MHLPDSGISLVSVTSVQETPRICQNASPICNQLTFSNEEIELFCRIYEFAKETTESEHHRARCFPPTCCVGCSVGEACGWKLEVLEAAEHGARCTGSCGTTACCSRVRC